AGGRGRKRKAEDVAEEEKASVKQTREEEEEQTVYGRNAEEVKSALLAAVPDVTVLINPEKPRRSSFEVTLKDEGKETCLWTGIKKGPPRKLKFPQPDVVVAALKEALHV
uniref:Selenoprotein H n=1 Tax=Gouania willdenowi TaxID=441366 RepID=A0A8C5HJR7_GOUWI